VVDVVCVLLLVIAIRHFVVHPDSTVEAFSVKNRTPPSRAVVPQFQMLPAIWVLIVACATSLTTRRSTHTHLLLLLLLSISISISIHRPQALLVVVVVVVVAATATIVTNISIFITPCYYPAIL